MCDKVGRVNLFVKLSIGIYYSFFFSVRSELNSNITQNNYRDNCVHENVLYNLKINVIKKIKVFSGLLKIT